MSCAPAWTFPSVPLCRVHSRPPPSTHTPVLPKYSVGFKSPRISLSSELGKLSRGPQIPGWADTVTEVRVSPAPWHPRAFLTRVAQPSLGQRMLGFGHLRRRPKHQKLNRAGTDSPPARFSAWAATWAKRGPRRGPQHRGAQTHERSLRPADRLGPSTRSTGCSMSIAPSPPGGTGRPGSRQTGIPPIPLPSSMRPGGAFP